MKTLFCRLVGLVTTVALVTQAVILTSPLSAQHDSPQRGAEVRAAPVFYLATNIVATTLSAWVQSRSSQTSLKDVLVAGVAGGSIMYAGQRMIGTRKTALRLPGMQTVAVGASVARNIATRSAAFSEITLPLFPFYLTIRQDSPTIHVRASAFALVNFILLSGRGYTPDLPQSLYSGAVIFRHHGEEITCNSAEDGICTVGRVGEHRFGAILYAHAPAPLRTNEVITHELAHASQDVRDAVLNALPFSDHALRAQGKFGRALANYVVLDFFLPLGLTSAIVGPPPFDKACRDLSRFHECEAYAILRNSGPDFDH